MNGFDPQSIAGSLSPRRWLIIGLLTAVLAASYVIHPAVGAGVFVFLVLSFLNISHKMRYAILFSFGLFFFFYKFEIQFLSSTKSFYDVFVVSTIPIIIVYVVWFLRRFTGIDPRSSQNYINGPLIFFIIWCLICLVWTRDTVHGVNLILQMTVNLMIVQILSVFIEDERDIIRVVKFFIGLGALLGIVVIASKYYQEEYRYELGEGFSFVMSFGGEKLGDAKKIRASGFAMSDQAAFALNFFTFLSIAFFMGVKDLKKRFKYFFIVFYFMLCATLVGSKGGLGSLVVGIYFMLLINPAAKGKRISWYIFLTLLLVSAVVLNLIIFNEGRIVKSVSGGASSKIAMLSFSTRIDIWKKGFKELYKVWGLGFGTGTSAAVAETLPHMHSFFFSALFDLGVIGFIMYCGMVLRVMWGLSVNIIESRSPFMKNLLCCMFGALVAASTQGLIISEFGFYYYWLIIGLVTAVTSKTFVVNPIEEDIEMIKAAGKRQVFY